MKACRWGLVIVSFGFVVISCQKEKSKDSDDDTNEDENETGACIVLNTTINDDICSNTIEADCTEQGAEWNEGSCEAHGLTVSCADGTFVEDGVSCPGGGGGVQFGCCVMFWDELGADACIASDDEDCAEDGGVFATISCEEAGFSLTCEDEVWIKEGMTCP